MDIREKLRTTDLYICNDENFVLEQTKRMDILHELNNVKPSDTIRRNELLKEFFPYAGDGLYIELPVRANWGFNTHWGKDCYANFNLTLVDDNEIFIGDNVMIAPNVVIATAGHPIDPELRRSFCQYAMPVNIGNNVWIGAGAIILPGVTIGDDTVIGAGAVVTKDIPSGVVAVGNPCRVLRKVNEYDKKYYFRECPVPNNIRVMK